MRFLFSTATKVSERGVEISIPTRGVYPCFVAHTQVRARAILRPSKSYTRNRKSIVYARFPPILDDRRPVVGGSAAPQRVILSQPSAKRSIAPGSRITIECFAPPGDVNPKCDAPEPPLGVEKTPLRLAYKRPASGVNHRLGRHLRGRFCTAIQASNHLASLPPRPRHWLGAVNWR